MTRRSAMKVLAYPESENVAWKTVPVLRLLQPLDVIIKITGTTVCGTVLHILKGDVPTVTSGRILGHEVLGNEVQENSLKVIVSNDHASTR